MVDVVRVDLFGEDAAHEAFGRSLIERIANETQLAVSIETRTAIGGQPRVLSELRGFQDLVSRGVGPRTPDLLVVMIDANDVGPSERRHQVEGVLQPAVFPRWVFASPDPYVEAWYLADPESFKAVVGARPQQVGRASRHHFKQSLVNAIEEGGSRAIQGGASFGPELVEAMDLYRAGKAVPSLGNAISDLRAGLRRASENR